MPEEDGEERPKNENAKKPMPGEDGEERPKNANAKNRWGVDLSIDCADYMDTCVNLSPEQIKRKWRSQQIKMQQVTLLCIDSSWRC